MDPLSVFASLGPVRVYRHPDAIKEQWAQVEAARKELEDRFGACMTDGERLALTVEVVSALVAVARRRSCDCQLHSADLACENLDVETILADWLDFVRVQTEPSAAAPRDGR